MVGYYGAVAVKMMTTHLTKRHLLEAIGSVVPSRGAAYVAGPLATGRKYYELLALGQMEAASDVREENELVMSRFVAMLRSHLSYPVIDPGHLKLENWTSSEVGEFYLEIINLFAKEVWFMEGWEYSRGATKEFQFAITRGITCLSASGHMMSWESGCGMIEAAIAHLTELGLDASRFADRLNRA